MSRALLFFFFAFSLSAFAQTNHQIYRLFPVLECPAVGDEFEKMISRLESIKTAIRQDANCGNVALQVKSLEELVVTERKKVMAILDGKKEEEIRNEQEGQVPASPETGLTPEQATLVRTYAEDVTKKIAALSDLIMQSNQCFAEDKKDEQLASLAGFVNEASQMVGSLTGPWGAPIALAGNVVAGFLTGLDQVLKTRHGYDFEKPEQWKSYVQNLCTYHSYREQIDHLLNPEARVSQLKMLKLALNTQISTMTKGCAACRSIEDAFQKGRGQNIKVVTDSVSGDVQMANAQNAKPYGTYMLQSLGLRDWVVDEMVRVEKEAQSYWGDVSGRYLLNQSKQSLEKFLFQNQAPKFLRFQNRKAQEDFAFFQAAVLGEGRMLTDSLNGTGINVFTAPPSGKWGDPIYYFRALVLNPLKLELLPAGEQAEHLKYRWINYRDQSLSDFRTAQNSAQVMQSFCSFFAHASALSRALGDQCADDWFAELVADENSIAKEIQASPLFAQGDKPLTINPLLQNTVFSASRFEALAKGIQAREL